MYMHPTYAVNTASEPLGLLDAWMWAGEPKDRDGQRGGAKESLRSFEGYGRLVELAPCLPTTRLVYVADREADMMPLMRMLARVGGFLAGKSGGEPGVKTIWEGLGDVRASARTVMPLREMGLLLSRVQRGAFIELRYRY